jgi:hypothetical protein
MRSLGLPGALLMLLAVACVTPSSRGRGLTNGGSVPDPSVASPGTTVTTPCPTDDRRCLSRVTSKVRTRLGAIKDCYEQALHRNPTLSGRIIIHWTIAPTGSVSEVNLEQDTLHDAEVASCIMALVVRWSFPPRAGGPVDVSFPFVFRSTQ